MIHTKRMNIQKDKNIMKKLIILSALTFMFACSSTNTTETQNAETSTPENVVQFTEAEMKSAGIQVSKVRQKDISSIVLLNGKIDVPPQNMVSVSMPMGGFLKSTQLLPGMHVKKGEVIATVEDQQYILLQQDYLSMKANLSFTEKEYQRQKELNLSKASSDKVFQQIEAEYTGQKIALKALSEKLKLINLNPDLLNESNLSRTVNMYSPIDGYVSKVNVNIGKYLNPSDVLFELINPEDIHLHLVVFEKDLNKLAIGQKLITYNNNHPDKKYVCEIILISQNLSTDGNAEVHCHFEEYDRSLFPGMYMNAEVKVTSQKANVIDDEALVSHDGKDFVFVSGGTNLFKMKEIVKGNSEGNFTEISFVHKVDMATIEIVNKGAYSLLMELKNKLEK